ncbi:hypothetical protein D3C87_172230 [compost metagenome]
MNAIKLVVALVMFTSYSQAQVSVNVSIGARPAPAPVVYNEARYYYLPEIESYYDIPNRQYVYIDNGAWVRRASLPVIYSHYNIYKRPKVIVNNYYGNAPYTYYKAHKAKHYKSSYKHKKNHGHDRDHDRGHKHGRGRD